VSENGANLLEARGVTKRFGTLAALKDVSFEIREGEVLGVIGPNGAGKTTLVNVIAGSAPGWTGEIRFRESSLRRLRPHRIGRIGIARTYQVAQPFGGMTALENVMVAALYGHERRSSVRDARARAEEILEQLGLTERGDTPSESLIAPDRKRLEIAKALATEPELVLLDEVMAGLNPAEVEQAVQLIERVRSRGVTIMLIEHVMQAVLRLADRVLVLHHGVKMIEGPTESVLADEQVIAAYLGARFGRRRR
jgi:branched-chain amino acid transport system ATP-binding protein